MTTSRTNADILRDLGLTEEAIASVIVQTFTDIRKEYGALYLDQAAGDAARAILQLASPKPHTQPFFELD